MNREATYPAAGNLLRLMKTLLESHYGLISFSEIMDRLEISRKTLSRYVKLMEEVFHEIVEVRSGSEIGRTPEGEKFLIFKRFALESRTGYQLAPLYLSRFFMSFLEGTLLDESFTDAVTLFESAVERPKYKNKAGSFGKKFFAVSNGPKSYAEYDDIIETLLQALIKQNPIEIEYKKPGASETKKYCFNPLTMMIYRQGLYIIGTNQEWPSPHFFAVERIRGCKRLHDKEFDYPRDYSPEELCGGSFGIFLDEEVDVLIHFSPEVPHEYIQSRRWHRSQETEVLANGGLELRMRIKGTQELFPWVMGFGKDAEVISPLPLRERVIEELQEMQKKYS